VSLSTLLDYDSVEERTIGSRHLRQIPFWVNSKPEYFNLSKTPPENVEIIKDSVLVSKMFLVESDDFGNVDDTTRTASYVVTMLARYQYCIDYGFKNLSYLHHPYFSGVIIFSEPDSRYDYVSYYEGGDLYKAELVTREEEGNGYLSHLEIVGTRGGSLSTGEEEVENVDGGSFWKFIWIQHKVCS